MTACTIRNAFRVYSVYAKKEYGKKPTTANKLTTDLVIENKTRGSITVTYDSDELEFLPEEQRMMDEIARTLVLAIERKELKANIDKRQEELHRERNKLEMLNSYLDRINRGFEESKTRLETIFQAIPDTVAIIDRDRNVVMDQIRTSWQPVASAIRLSLKATGPVLIAGWPRF